MVFLWILILLLLWSFIEQKLLTTSNYEIEKISEDGKIHNLSFIVLADLHNRRFGKDNSKLVLKIDQLKPDFIIVAGDLITKQELCIPGDAYSLIKNLVDRYPIFYSYGNHEQNLDQLAVQGFKPGKQGLHKKALHESWLEYKKQLRILGVKLLDNESSTQIIHNVRINITGVSIGREYFSKKAFFPMKEDYLENLVGAKKQTGYQILIAHNPVYFKDYINWGADTIVSGHLHGGLIRLPHLGGIVSPQYRFFPKYDAGKFRENDQQMIVSRGLGSHSIMLRLFNRPELVVVRLKLKDK